MTVKLREKKLAKGSVRFYLDIYVDGERDYEFLDIKLLSSDSKNIRAEKKEIANFIRSQREIELITKNINYLPKHLRRVNFFDFAQTFIDNYTKKDVRMIEATLSKFKGYIKNEKLKVVDITPSIISGYKDFLTDKSGLNGETPRNYFARFKKIIKDAVLKGLLKEDPTLNIRFKKSSTSDTIKKNILTTNELRKLAKTQCGNSEVKNAFLFACYTGLGFAEIKMLKWINVIDNRLTTKREKTNQKVEIKLKEGLIKLIGNRQDNEIHVFDLKSRNEKFISDTAVNKCIKNWVKRAKINKHITFYCARHTFATQLLQYGANLKTVADSLGHASTRETTKYLNYIDNLKDDAVDNLPELKF